MSNEKVMNRWLVVIGAVLIQLCLGAIYAWSVFTPKLTDANGAYKFSANEAFGIFSVGIFVFALTTIISGRKMTTVGPRKLAIASAFVLGAGYVLGAFLGTSFAAQMICIGVIGGAGIGLGYVVPIAVGIKWFPDKKGMVTGLAVAGFGFGATIWVKWAGSWGGGLLNTLSLAGLDGVRSTFLLYGILWAILVTLGSFVMKNPPEGWLPEGYTPPAAGTASATGGVEFETGEMLKTPQYYMLAFTFLFSALAGLMVIACIQLFGIDILVFSSINTLDKANEGYAAAAAVASSAAGTAMAVLAILNGLGRIAWGTVSDKLGRKMSLVLMCLFQGVVLLAFYKLGSTPVGLAVGAALIGFNFGGNFALFPAATADFFGNKNVGKNYGFVFAAYGIAGIVGPQIGGFFKNAAQGATEPSAWLMPFMIAGGACLLGAVISILNKAPKK